MTDRCLCPNNGGGDCDYCMDQRHLKMLRDQHNEQVMCSECKEWTTFGESCCGATQCEDECPACKESA